MCEWGSWGHAKCLLLMARGGGKKLQKHAYVIHGCSLRKMTFAFCRADDLFKDVKKNQLYFEKFFSNSIKMIKNLKLVRYIVEHRVTAMLL